MKNPLLFTLLCSSLSVHSQSWIGFSIGGNLYDLKFTNSAGIKNNDLIGLPGLKANVTFEKVFHKNKGEKNPALNLFTIAAGYKSGSIKDKSNHLFTTWSLNYFSLTAAARRYTTSAKRANLLYGFGFGNDLLINATQNRGFEQYDLSKEIQKINFHIGGEFGLRYLLTESSHCTLTLSYVRGLTNIETDRSQRAMLHALEISIAVFFDLSKKNN